MIIEAKMTYVEDATRVNSDVLIAVRMVILLQNVENHDMRRKSKRKRT